METLCPFFKENCHGNQCAMWHNEECVIVAFLRRIQEGMITSEETMPSSEEPIERTGMVLHREEEEAPEWLKIATPKALAEEIIEFKEKEFPKEHIGFHRVSRFYWSEKGVQEFLMPPEISIKIHRAEMLAETELLRKEQAEKRERLEKEKEELPSLVSQFVDWSRLRSLKRATLADVEVFVLDKDIDILKETKRAIFSMANAKLKSKQ
jgi:hypothetical protein